MHRVAPLEIIKLILSSFIILKKWVPSGKDGKPCTCNQSITVIPKMYTGGRGDFPGKYHKRSPNRGRQPERVGGSHGT